MRGDRPDDRRDRHRPSPEQQAELILLLDHVLLQFGQLRRGADRVRSAGVERALVLVVEPLAVDAMREGAAHMIGRHDFTTFRSAHCQAAGSYHRRMRRHAV